jgi:dienelactone hydrolase
MRVLGCAILAIGLGATPARAQPCNPFGNAPRTMVANVAPTTCVGGVRVGPWTDGEGSPRHACLYAPPWASAARRLPLVVYLHPSLFTADTVPVTNLLPLVGTADVSGDPARRGFILLAPEGRATTHFYPFPDDQGTGWDNWYRQLDPSGATAVVDGVAYPQNVDAAAIDHFVDAVVATGAVDTRRIYVTGWSNGAAMGYLYGLSRPSIAAVAVYSSPDPFRAFDDPCPQTPVVGTPAHDGEAQVWNLGVPTLHVHNDCDIAGICPNGVRLAASLLPLGVGVEDVIINALMLRVGACREACGTNPDGDLDPADNPLGYTVGTANHGRWPYAWTQRMLAFFRAHPR